MVDSAGIMVDNVGIMVDNAGTAPGGMVDNARGWGLEQPFDALDRRCRDQDV